MIIYTNHLVFVQCFLPEDIEDCIRFARSYREAQSSDDREDRDNDTTSPTSNFSSLGFVGDAVSSIPDPHDVSKAEAQSYYAGLHSEPTLLYRTGKDSGLRPGDLRPSAVLKEICEVFTHPIAKVWNNDLGWKVVEVLDAHTVS